MLPLWPQNGSVSVPGSKLRVQGRPCEFWYLGEPVPMQILVKTSTQKILLGLDLANVAKL